MLDGVGQKDHTLVVGCLSEFTKLRPNADGDRPCANGHLVRCQQYGFWWVAFETRVRTKEVVLLSNVLPAAPRAPNRCSPSRAYSGRKIKNLICQQHDTIRELAH